MVVFGKMDEPKVLTSRVQEFGSQLKKPGIALHFPLMISCSQSRIIDEKLLLMLDTIEFMFCAAISDQNVLYWDATTPMFYHPGNRRCGLMSEDEVENGIH